MRSARVSEIRRWIEKERIAPAESKERGIPSTKKKLVDAAFFFFFPFNFAPYLRSERGVQILGAVHVTLDEGLESGRGVER